MTPYGAKTATGSNQGITIAAIEGSPFRATRAGKVAFVGNNVPEYGNMVIVEHADGMMSSYAHAQKISVAKGEAVSAGAVLGLVGKSGGVTTPQLHFALRQGEQILDPLSRLPQQVAGR